MMSYTTSHRQILKQEGVNEKILPHSGEFYFDLFAAALSLIS